MAERKRPTKEAPTPPAEDVVRKIDPDHSDDDFLRDLHADQGSPVQVHPGVSLAR